MIRAARACVAGQASGPALVLTEALSFYGGIDPASGKIIDPTNSRRGEYVCGRIMVMPAGRGSSSSSSVFVEAIRAGTGPAGLVLGRIDPILPVAGIVASTLYGIDCPIVVCSIAGIDDGAMVTIIARPDRSAEVRV